MAALLRLRSRRLLRAWAGSAAAFFPLPFPLALAGGPSAGAVKCDRGLSVDLSDAIASQPKAAANLTGTKWGCTVCAGAPVRPIAQPDCLSAGIRQQLEGAAWTAS